MKVSYENFEIGRLIDLWGGTVRVNQEYQRGPVWTQVQKQMLIDSVFRGYPLPLFYLHEKTKINLRGEETHTHEVIDGQQRIRALEEFRSNKWRLLDPKHDANKMRLPSQVKQAPCPWGGRSFEELTAEQGGFFLNTSVNVVVISEATDEEVRDLFIRLQSGTTLSRQQIRDAWPGKVGPFIESLAGKGALIPKSSVFKFIDNRGNRDDADDDTDLYVNHRQACTQALLLFLERQKDPYGVTSVTAKNLDNLYHENTDFDAHGPVAQRFVRTLDLIEKTLTLANKRRDDTGTVFRKLEIFSLLLFYEELTRDPNTLVDEDVNSIATSLVKILAGLRQAVRGRATSLSTIKEHYDEFYWGILPYVQITKLDRNRAFSPEQKAKIRTRDKGICQICHSPVPQTEEEYDHVKPWILGGSTTLENGRLVHSRCHPRGRSAVTSQTRPATGD